ncbi:MAG: pseudouridine synthase [Candidatus Saccharimonadales bacterium]
MRINQFVALATGLSRRQADKLIINNTLIINGQPAQIGQAVSQQDAVKLHGQTIKLPATSQTIIFNKPAGYVVSRDGQGSPTIYDILPKNFHNLKPVGRLDKDSSGLLLLTNDGQLAQKLTHPRFAKQKIYEVELNKPLAPKDKTKLDRGIKVDNYLSRLRLSKIAISNSQVDNRSWRVAVSQGRNRQIRRTFAALNYRVIKLHRTNFGDYILSGLPSGQWKFVV